MQVDQADQVEWGAPEGLEGQAEQGAPAERVAQGEQAE